MAKFNSVFNLDKILIPIKMEKYYKKIMDKANQAGMLVLYDNDSKYILVVKYWDSESGNICGSRYPISGNF